MHGGRGAFGGVQARGPGLSPGSFWFIFDFFSSSSQALQEVGSSGAASQQRRGQGLRRQKEEGSILFGVGALTISSLSFPPP